MELRTLHYFLAVAREKNMTGAANMLHITQPTLSRQMADLEEELGKQLFVRTNRSTHLTEEESTSGSGPKKSCPLSVRPKRKSAMTSWN